MVSFEFENQVNRVLSASVDLKAKQKADKGYSGLIFMLIVCREYLYPLHVLQLTPSAILSCSPRRYCPLGLAVWQLLYQKPPLKEVAHWPLAKSLSTSLVENCIPLWEDKESPETKKSPILIPDHNICTHSYMFNLKIFWFWTGFRSTEFLSVICNWSTKSFFMETSSV